MTKWNLFRHQTTPMVAAKPTGASTSTVTPAPVALVSADNSTEPVSKNDAFDEIKNKFLNEIDKIPCEYLTQLQRVVIIQLTLALELDCLFRCRHQQPHNVFIWYWSVAALPNGKEIKFSPNVIANLAPPTRYIWPRTWQWLAGQMSELVAVWMFCLHLALRLLLSAIVGHHCHRRGRCIAHPNVLLLHCQEMLLQEEEEQEGEEGEGGHGNEEPERGRGRLHRVRSLWGSHLLIHQMCKWSDPVNR